MRKLMFLVMFLLTMVNVVAEVPQTEGLYTVTAVCYQRGEQIIWSISTPGWGNYEEFVSAAEWAESQNYPIYYMAYEGRDSYNSTDTIEGTSVLLLRTVADGCAKIFGQISVYNALVDYYDNPYWFPVEGNLYKLGTTMLNQTDSESIGTQTIQLVNMVGDPANYEIYQEMIIDAVGQTSSDDTVSALRAEYAYNTAIKAADLYGGAIVWEGSASAAVSRWLFKKAGYEVMTAKIWKK